MLTQCPNCETTFRITADILRVADGQVRCGRCQTQFDALERLIEEEGPNAAESGRFLQTGPRAAPAPSENPRSIEIDEPQSVEQITLEGRRIEISGRYRRVDDVEGAADVPEEVVETWVEFDDEPDADTIDVSEFSDTHEQEPTPPIEDASPPGSEPHAPSGASQEMLAEALPETDTDSEPIDEPPPEPPRPTRAPLGSRLLLEPEVDHESADDLSALMPQRRATALIWKLAVVPLALLLIAQVVHHHRAELARHPRVGAPLMSVYRALGLQLTPDWNLHAYGVKQWGVVMNPSAPGTLMVRASITNNASFAQPYPLLKLVLEDRWGDQVRAREFEPAEYLDPGTAPNRLLGPMGQVNATISIVDPGPDAEGFRFDVCLRGKAGPVCAADLPPG